jgi:recombination DNA repair RAD52 pathway protein
MTDAQRLASALNPMVKDPQFSYVKARAAARTDGHVNWPATKAHNEDFNPDVDGCESFVMNDGSRCEWQSGQFKYKAS